MNRQQFQVQIEKMRLTYGPNTYPAPVEDALWEEIKNVSNDRFRKAINRTLANNPNSKYPPGIEEIEKHLALIREDEVNEIRTKIEKELNENKLSNEDVNQRIGEILKNNFGPLKLVKEEE